MRDISVKEKDFYADGVKIASSYTRLVSGGRGKYVEFPAEAIAQSEIEIEPGQEYRFSGKWLNLAYYGWYRIKESHKKVYFQYKKVDYADYLPGYYYIALKDLTFEGELYEEESFRPLD